MTTTGANTADFRGATFTDDELAATIVSLWNEWKSARSKAEALWTETKKYVYATSTRDTTNNKLPWSNTTHRPVLYNIYNNLLVNTDFSLFPNRDWLEFYGFDASSSSADKRKVTLAYLNTKHRMSGFRKVMRKLESDWLLYGNCFGGVEYVTEYSTDPITGEKVPAYVGPRPYRISPYDIVFNPKASDFAHSPKIIRSKMTMGELEIALEEKPSLNYDPAIVAAMKDDRVRAMTMEDDSELEDSFIADGYGSSNEYYKSGHVLIYELYGDIYDKVTGEMLKNHVITVADGRYILRKQPLNTFSGRPNIFHSVWRERPDSLWGIGPLDNLVGLQYRIDHLENAKADAFDNMIDPDLVFLGDVEEVKHGASTRYYARERGDVKTLVPDTTVLNADLQIQEIRQEMELDANAPRTAVGFRTPGEKTAFEVDTLNNSANRPFEYQTQIFSEFLEDIVNAEIEIAVTNLHTSDIVAVIDDDFGVEEFISITREDLVSNGKVIPVGAREFARKQKVTNQLQGFYQVLAQDPELMQHFPSVKLAKLWSEVLDFEELREDYGRIPERLESANRQSIAQDRFQERQLLDTGNVSNDQQDQQGISQTL